MSLALLFLLILSPSAHPADTASRYLSKTFLIDRKYPSMAGPHETRRIRLTKDPGLELLWIRGVKGELVGPDGRAARSPEFMCHVNLDMDGERHRKLFGWAKAANERLMTLSQGQFEIELPRGFGIPVLSDEPLFLAMQVLNHNLEKPKVEVRHKITVSMERDRALRAPLTPLFPASAFVLALLEGKDGHFGVEKPGVETAGASCLPGKHAAAGIALGLYEDPYGRKMTGHWVVPPGREVRRTVVTKMLNIPFDTTLHYAAVHLHPFAESLELRDLTSGRSVFKSKASNIPKGIGLDRVGVFSSAAGTPVFQGHEYELVSVFDNTSGADQDAMASMFLYLKDKEFRSPSLK